MAKTQHRPKREEAKAQELASLKRENHTLKREVKRLKKEINKRIEVEEEVAESGLEECVKVTLAINCSECGNGVMKSIVFNNKEYLVCSNCKARKKGESCPSNEKSS